MNNVFKFFCTIVFVIIITVGFTACKPCTVLFTNLEHFFTAILDDEGNFTVNETLEGHSGGNWKLFREIKRAEKNTYSFGTEWDGNYSFRWWEEYYKNNYPLDGDCWYRNGNSEASIKTGTWETSSGDWANTNVFLAHDGGKLFYDIAENGAFTKNGNEYTLHNAPLAQSITSAKIIISPTQVIVEVSCCCTDFELIFTNFGTTSVVLPD